MAHSFPSHPCTNCTHRLTCQQQCSGLNLPGALSHSRSLLDSLMAQCTCAKNQDTAKIIQAEFLAEQGPQFWKTIVGCLRQGFCIVMSGFLHIYMCISILEPATVFESLPSKFLDSQYDDDNITILRVYVLALADYLQWSLFKKLIQIPGPVHDMLGETWRKPNRLRSTRRPWALMQAVRHGDVGRCNRCHHKPSWLLLMWVLGTNHQQLWQGLLLEHVQCWSCFFFPSNFLSISWLKRFFSKHPKIPFNHPPGQI